MRLGLYKRKNKTDPKGFKRGSNPSGLRLRRYALGMELQFEGATGEDGIVSYGCHYSKW